MGAALLFFVLLLVPAPAQAASDRASPARRSLVLLALALACLLPILALPVAPGLSLASTEATLLYWRDGFPATYEPLAPIPAFGAHAPGLPWLAADVSRLSGLAPHRAVLLWPSRGPACWSLGGRIALPHDGAPRGAASGRRSS